MAKIRNSFNKNFIGDGYEKIITLDNGDEYIVRNSLNKNFIGDEYEQEIIKKDNSEYNYVNVPNNLFTKILRMIILVPTYIIAFAFIGVAAIATVVALFMAIRAIFFGI